MALHNPDTEKMNLILSSDAKPRLKWTQQLHQRFVEAVDRLGGAEKATPKSVMRVMEIDGLTLYHLKSHLQKYRTGKSQQLQKCHQNNEEDYGEKQSNFSGKHCDGAKEHINESLQITRALHMQMEVQKKLHEQIEVQRHLQLRIEAQAKYLQSVITKAKETLSQHRFHSIEIEQAKTQLSHLLSTMVESECPSPSFSVLTQSEGSTMSKDDDKNDKLLGRYRCSFESPWPDYELDDDYIQETGETALVDINRVENDEPKRKRTKSDIDDEIKHREVSSDEKKLRLLEGIDLNF